MPLLARLSVLLAALLLAAPAGAAGPERARVPALEFLGQEVLPTGLVFGGTEVGGLSGIAYDARRGVFYGLSDDPSPFAPARFYTLRVDVSDGRLGTGDVSFLGVTTLTGPGGLPFAPFSLDPEGIALAKDDRLVITSEGFANSGIDPFLRLFDLGGAQVGELPVPRPFLPAPGRGVRQNLAFEAGGIGPNGRFFFTGTEGALVQDGPPATLAAGSPSRLLRYNLQTGRLDRQFLYWTDAIAEPPVPPGAFAVSGLVDLLPLNNEFLLAMERSFSVGAPGTGNSIRLYRVALPGADNVDGADALAGALARLRPAEKVLLLDLGALGLPLDNVEGMSFGPDLPDGRRSLVLVSDNNFSAGQFTQFLLFGVSGG